MLQPDKLADDLALIIDTDFGLVVILGCAHRGIVNTLRQAQKPNRQGTGLRSYRWYAPLPSFRGTY